MLRPVTISELRQAGHQVLPVRQEMRQNLKRMLSRGEDPFPGVVGYEDSVVPQVETAVLSGHDIILLGERGQAKTRLLRSLVNLLDPETPAIAGCELMDNPFAPICTRCRLLVEESGDEVEVTWVDREQRYGEKLATPDTSIADLIGEVDPIKVAEGRYLADELTIHYGLVPRTNRGIFAINELPDLAEKIQVGLFNILEERDVQVRGYKLRLPLDIFLVASANPEDYTSRGRIITPLKDRFGSMVRTHYPMRLEQEVQIMEQERTSFADDEVKVVVPAFMKDVVARLTHLARRSPQINQRSGVSVRVSITNYENLVSSALRRALLLGETEAAPRVSDLAALVASTAGKVEVESFDDTREDRVFERLSRQAVDEVFKRQFSAHDFQELMQRFDEGLVWETSAAMPAADSASQARESPSLMAAAARLECTDSPALLASAAEFILEGLHAGKRLNKDRAGDVTAYRA
ncbi:MAG: magnesium chelatase [Candidatus Dormibacteria bacterium]